MGSLVQGVLAANQNDRLGTKANGTPGLNAARGLVQGRVDGGVICTFYTDKDDMIKTRNSMSVSVCDDPSRSCQLCRMGNKGKELGKVLCFQNSTGGTSIYLHHSCANFAVCNKEFVVEDLVDALDMASRRRCGICSQLGACVQCSYGECDKWYHLHCSTNATDVVVDIPQGYLFCPKHTVPDSDESEEVGSEHGKNRIKKFVEYDMDDDFALSRKKPRTSVGTSRGKKKVSNQRESSGKGKGDGAQRPRTDWQRRGSNTWMKIVPPWWSEQKTVHFANKVFRELFSSATMITLVDNQGAYWTCEVVAETRNDMRLQYTLKGQFQALWDSMGITPGDVLTFEKGLDDPYIIHLVRSPNGEGFEELLQTKVKKKNPEHPPQQTVTNKIVSETPWYFVDDTTARKVLQATNLAKMKCLIPERLCAKIFNRPDVGNTFAVYDAHLKKHYVFEIEVTVKDEKYLKGKGFMSWLVERALKPDDGIQIVVSDSTVQVSKIPSDDMRKAIESSTDTLTTCSSTSMDTLAAAAFYARTHGTPGIRAILCDSLSEQQTEHTREQSTMKDTITADQPPCDSMQINGSIDGVIKKDSPVLSGKLIDNKAKKIFSIPPALNQVAIDPKLSIASFHATMQVISRHTWTEEEHNLILKFRSKFAALDYIGREITSYSILQFKDNKSVLLEILKSFVASIPAKKVEP